MILPDSRRGFLRQSAIASTAALGWLGSALPSLGEQKPEEVSPAEDLMREHGLLNRLLLIYEQHVHLIDTHQAFNPSFLSDAAGIVRRFVEDYHEKLEENFLFPRFRKAMRLTELVDTLNQQHEAGRRLTATIQQLAVPDTAKDQSRALRLSDTLKSFLRIYRPHEAREDTVLFPEFKKIVSPHEYGALGDEFEKQEDQLFGEDGFFKVVDQVAALEKKLGIYDLSQFTPK
jgi:hemerythrin-like domain-containing protein